MWVVRNTWSPRSASPGPTGRRRDGGLDVDGRALVAQLEDRPFHRLFVGRFGTEVERVDGDDATPVRGELDGPAEQLGVLGEQHDRTGAGAEQDLAHRVARQRGGGE